MAQSENVTEFGSNSTCEDVLRDVDITGKTYVVTGGSSGIGKQTVISLVTHGAMVISCVRNVEKMLTVINELELPQANIQVVELSLNDLDSVRACAERILGVCDSLDAVFLNAGIMYTPERQVTVQNFEYHFGINYLGHALLAGLLYPLLLSGAPSRLVYTSSASHVWNELNFDDLQLENNYTKKDAYGQSCTARCTFAAEFTRHYRDSNVVAFSVHPGVIMTDLQRDFTSDDFVGFGMKNADGTASEGAEHWMKSVEQGAATQVWAATSPQLNGLGGEYLLDCGIGAPNTPDSQNPFAGYAGYVMDPQKGAQLWDVTQQLTGFTFPHSNYS